ncbi:MULTISPECIES: hypothetical protein [Planktothricoides]|uniref:Uncharacterized protein n=2 Tax=Planktothricoides raciborskii TaxID=132608 RepID=A0AAU8J8M2_9CYAN|nr:MULTISPECIES: hypothetical protein [Planktothricoides]MBD2546972.1 hypothetical protein [Planktothricoides raciborskii FACHB-1370]MBD2585487.1 hypothetical protein [Planktothricoides raciborskii FACHB-1261]
MFHNSFGKSVVAIALSLPIIAFTGYGVLAEDDTESEADTSPVIFTLINNTSRTLQEFYASPPSTNDWEEDILGVDTLAPGKSAEITINDRRPDCIYDFKGVLAAAEDGSVGEGALIQTGINVCEDKTYEYSEN